jgi:acyl-CoA thioesterase FadM
VEFDDHLKIYPVIVDQSKHVVKFEYEIKSDEKAKTEVLIAKAKTTLVAVDKTGKIADIPEKYQTKLAHVQKN